MRRTVVWIVGEPGAGKTTLARELLGRVVSINLKPKWTVGESAFAAGHYTGEKFDGADTVPYNGAHEALEFWRETLQTQVYSRPELTILDGDRFSNKGAIKFFEPAQGADRLCCVHLIVPSDVGLERRRRRGSSQDASWVKGRVTKSARFADTFPASNCLRLDADKLSPSMMQLAAKKFLCTEVSK